MSEPAVVRLSVSNRSGHGSTLSGPSMSVIVAMTAWSAWPCSGPTQRGDPGDGAVEVRPGVESQVGVEHHRELERRHDRVLGDRADRQVQQVLRAAQPWVGSA
jgi:hypothetical protein